MIDKLPGFGEGDNQALEFVEETGRVLYEAHMLCGLNRLPVQVLMSYVVRKPKYTGVLPFHPNELFETWCSEGPVLAIKDPVTDKWRFEKNICEASENKVELEGINAEGKKVEREYRHVGQEWQVWEEVEGDDKPTLVATMPDRAVYLYLNPIIPRGILWPVQRLLKQLESLAATKAILSDESVATNFFTDYGGSERKLSDSLKERTVNKVLPAGTIIQQSGGSPLYPQVLADEESLKKDYLTLTYLVVPDRLDRVTGVVMQYALTPQTNFVDNARIEIKKIYADFGVKDIEFEILVLRTAQERIELLTLLDMALATAKANAIVIDNSQVEKYLKDVLWH